MTRVQDTPDPLAGLSPERRLLLQKVLQEKARARSAPAELRPVPRGGALPLSFAQTRFWFIDQMEPGSAAHNITSALRLRGRLDAEALHRTLTEIVRRHEVLRTVFAVRDEEPVQVVLPPAPVLLPRVDLSGLPEEARERELLRTVEEASLLPFDLARGPLFRCRLVVLGPDRAAMVMGMHHIVSDGWSMEVLTRELLALYGAFSKGLPSPLPELPIQYADYAAWQRQWLTGEGVQRELEWWRERLAGAPPVLDLPTDRPRPVLPGMRGEKVPVEFRAAVVGPLRAL
ncbi:MAG TPA: condensation domain-containing protein, partial [Longimicrobiaceae bacterium]